MKGNIVSEHDYDKLFEKAREFKKKQNAQKQRGLNDYNMVNIVRSEAAEVGMHSNVIYSLIDPYGLHYQDDLFLQYFISDVLDLYDFGSSITVEAEEHTCDNRRIDFTIKSDKYYIGIEMKVNAHDLKYQLFDYHEDLIEKAKGEKEVIIYYLTKNGREASEYSYKKDGKSIEYRQISFEKHILNWIDSCQKEVRNITNLNEAFSNYREIVKKIVNQYEGKVMQFKNKLLENEDLYQLAGEVSRAFEEAKRDKIEKKRSDAFTKICNLLGQEDIEYEKLDEQKAIFMKRNFYIKIISQENQYLLQVTNTNAEFDIIDKIKKDPILKNLQKIDKSFKSSYNRVFGAMEIPYKDINMQRIIDIIKEVSVLEDS